MNARQTHRREHNSWRAMHARCGNPRDVNFRFYGARGIQVCGRWASFAAFLQDMGNRPEHSTLDRIDTNGNYEAANCRWASAKDQAINRRNRSANPRKPKRETPVTPLRDVSHRRTVQRVCHQCGAHFLAIPGAVNAGRALYCSKRCVGISSSQRRAAQAAA